MRTEVARALSLTATVLLLLLSVGVNLAYAADVTLEGAKLSIASVDGSARISKGFSATKSPEIDLPFSIDSDEVLRVAFTLKNTEGEKLAAGKAPHQVVVLMQDSSDPSIASTSIINIKPSSGKASWNLRMDRLPQDLVRQGGGLIDVALLLGFFGSAEPIKLPLITLQLPSALISPSGSAPSARERNLVKQGFQRHADHRHTFAVPAADQMPPVIVSLAAAIVTLVLPFVVFGAFWTQLAHKLSLKAPSSAALPFLIALVAIDALALLYWNGAGLTLFKMLPWLLFLSSLTVFTGRSALTDLRRVRLGKKA